MIAFICALVLGGCIGVIFMACVAWNAMKEPEPQPANCGPKQGELFDHERTTREVYEPRVYTAHPFDCPCARCGGNDQ